MLEFTPSSSGPSGDATASAPAADTGAIESGGVATEQAASAATETNFDSESASADPTLQLDDVLAQIDAPAEGEQPDAAADADDPEAALAAYANDPNTPRFAREQIQKAMAYAGTLKSTLSEREAALNDLQSRYTGKEALDPAEITRLQQAEDALYDLASPIATPDVATEKLQSLMSPENFAALQNQMVWSALAKPDGTPDLNNIQLVVDSLTGEPGTVEAAAVLEAIAALKEGRIDKDDLHSFESVEAYESYKRQQAVEKELKDRQARAEENLVFQEQQVRTQTAVSYQGNIQREVETNIQGLLGKYKLEISPNDPKEAVAFKERTNDRIAKLVNTAHDRHRELGDLFKALNAIQSPRKMDAKTAASQVETFLRSPQVEQLRNKGLSKLNSEIEKAVVEEARVYDLVMKGLAAENSKGQQARPVIGAPNQAASIPGLTQADLAKMSNRERADYNARRFTEAIRAGNAGIGVNGIG